MNSSCQNNPQLKLLKFVLNYFTLFLTKVIKECEQLSVGKALHRYRRGRGFESRSGLLSRVFNRDDKSCLHIFLRNSNIWPFIY